VYDLDVLSRGILQWIRGWEVITEHPEHASLSLMYTKRPPPSRRSTQNGKQVKNRKQEQVQK